MRMHDAERRAGQQLSVVLVVDDESSVRMVSTLMLERLGYRALEAASGPEGVALFREHGTDVAAILLDVSMPDVDGWETLGRLREAGAAVRVVMMSGSDEDELMSCAPSGESLSFLHKPFRLGTLRKALA